MAQVFQVYNKFYTMPANENENAFSMKDIHVSQKEVDENKEITDSAADEAKMQPETFTIDLPDVKDIPGQEHIHVPDMKEMADTTISSADEEGEGLFDDEEDQVLISDEQEISGEEKTLLQKADEDTSGEDDDNLSKSSLDTTDDEGAPLNESSMANDKSGSDLDISGADEDDADELTGEEDEENNAYSLGSEDNDNVTEGTP